MAIALPVLFFEPMRFSTAISRLALIFISVAMASSPAVSQELGSAPKDSTADRIAFASLDSEQNPILASDIRDRALVIDLYNTQYLPGNSVTAGWTGSISTCSAGTTSAAYRDATLQRVNFYRTMAGLANPVTLDAGANANCQEAALMMSANNSLSHNPPSTWTCYSTTGAQAAGQSNIALGAAGPRAIDLYIDDPGAGNSAGGHRRWILYPPQSVLGTGSVSGSGATGSNALKVIGGWGSRPVSPVYIPWPPEGYVPMPVMPCSSRRWSFSYPSADFSAATVTMTENGTPLTVTKEPLSNGYGDNTLVWIPQWSCNQNLIDDITYVVKLSNVLINSVPREFTYTVIAINPTQTGTTVSPPRNLRVTP
jgi:hypothetical protein